MYVKSTRMSAKREVQKERSATIKSRALGALKLASEASCARSARWECAREAGRFFFFSISYKMTVSCYVLSTIFIYRVLLSK